MIVIVGVNCDCLKLDRSLFIPMRKVEHNDLDCCSARTRTNSDVLDALLSSISVEEDISQELFNLVLQDDEDSGYCIFNKASKGKVNGIDGIKSFGIKANEPKGSIGKSSKIVSNGTSADKSPLLAAVSGEPSLNTAALGESSNRTADVPNLCFPEEHADSDDTNYICRLVKDDMVELQFEIDLQLAKILEMKHMKADGNSLFAAVASQLYGDPDLHDVTRRYCMSFMVQNPEYYSRFVNGDFSSYVCGRAVTRDRRDFMRTTALSIFTSTALLAGNSTPVRLSSHYGGHYNSLVELSHEFLFGGLHGGNTSNVPRSSAMNSFGADDSEDDDDEVMAALLNYVAGGAMPIGGIIIFGPGPDWCYNSCELALGFGYGLEEVAAAYRTFGEDGSSMLYYILENDMVTLNPLS